MTEHQKDTAFLRDLLLFENTEESHELEQKVERAQSDEHCIQRALWLMALFAAVAGIAFGYGTIMQEDFSAYDPRFAKLICEVGLASLICLMVFAVVLKNYRNKLNGLREECREFCLKRLESHPLQSHRLSIRNSATGTDEREAVLGPANTDGFSAPHRMQLGSE